MKKKSNPLPTNNTVYPIGSYIETEKGYFYISDSNKRLRVISKRVLDSWSPHRVIKTTESAVSKYKCLAKISFRNGSLIWSISDGKMYLIEKGLKRHIVSPDALIRIGASESDVVAVSLDEINLHRIGEPLS